MATYTKYEQFVLDLGLKIHDLKAAGDQLKIALSNTAPVDATDAVLADISEIAAGNGYTAGGEDVQNDYTEAGGVASLTGTTIVFTATPGGIGPFRYAILYNDTPSTPLKPLIGYWDYGSSISLLDTETFTVTIGADLFTVT